MHDPTPSQLALLPLTGRRAELQMIHSLLDRADAGRGGALILRGPSGVGKSRLLRAAREDAARRRWRTALGRAYPVASGIPYAPFTDAFLPILRGLPDESLMRLMRGAEAGLIHIFPHLRPADAASGHASTDAGELKTRLLAGCAHFVSDLAASQPLLLILDDLQWADASSLELLHFLCRQIGGDRIALLCAYNNALGELSSTVRVLELSLAAQDDVPICAIHPLSQAETATLIHDLFDMDGERTDQLAALLYARTRGNPFFLEEIIKTMVQSGRLRRYEGAWVGWEGAEIGLPTSVRDAVLQSLEALSAAARELAELMSVIGTNIAHASLRSICPVGEVALVEAVDELRRLRVLEERLEGTSVVYDFTHPVLRETVYGELGLARAELLHTRVAETLEAGYGGQSILHADELAYHFSRSRSPEHAGRAVHYLCAAGRTALQKYSNSEASDYLSAALQRAEVAGAAGVPAALLEDLARARRRLGDFDGAADLLRRRREMALAANDLAGVAATERRLGLIRFWSGRHADALDYYRNGLEWATQAGDRQLHARLKLSEGDCLLELGRALEARECIHEALQTAESLDDQGLVARSHLALLLLHTWAGPPEEAWAHGERTLQLAQEMGDRGLCCTAHWGLTILAGLTGNPAATARHLGACTQMAEDLKSPLHRLRAAELAVEYSGKTGDWAAGIALGERAIASARALRQRALLARLLVWTALIHIGRGDTERGRRYVDEAWHLAEETGSGGAVDVHTMVPAHCGRAAHYVAVGEFAAAVRVGLEGLAIAEGSGYRVWAIHRLLPIVAEAFVSMGDVRGAARIGARLRRDSERWSHQLGLAWADACDGFLVWLGGDIAEGIEKLRQAADRLEAISVIPDAARLRRHLAARLRDHGRREEALAELRHAHEMFVRLGAEGELAKTRGQIRELGARPPVRDVPRGFAGLSAREIEIGRLVAARKSNKSIAKVLEISPRTVGTHISNIFRKLGVDSRAALTDVLERIEAVER